MEIKIPGEFCGAFYGPFRKFGKITKEYFDRDSNLRLHIEISESQIDQVAFHLYFVLLVCFNVAFYVIFFLE